MDVSAIVQEYDSVSSFGHQILLVLPHMLFAVAAMVGFTAWLAVKNKWDRVEFYFLTGMFTGLGILVGMGAGIVFGPAETGQTSSNRMVEQVSAQAKETYGVNIPESAIESAYWEADEGQTVSVSVRHGNTRKSLDIQFDMDTKEFIVYQGNVELEPIK